MAKVFTLEAVAAKHGDALLLHYGDHTDPQLILIDGGPRGVYNRFLKKRLNVIRERRADPVPLNIVMVSHVDDDHIAGILDLGFKMNDADADGRHVPFEIGSMWFNAFDDVLGNVEAAAFRDEGAAASVASELRPTGAIIASVGQGRKLRDLANSMGVEVNGGDNLIVGGFDWDLGDGLEFRVLGPRQAELDAFQERWDREVRRNGWATRRATAEVAAFLDESATNLASIVGIARQGTKSILLTGDARGDHILSALRESGDLSGNSMKVSVLKVPHHGSDNNVTTGFFRKVRADHYVISGDGNHGNPEIATLKMILEARGSARFKVHLTYRNPGHGEKPKLDRFLRDLPQSQRRKFVFRGSDDLSLKVELGRRIGI